MESPRPTKDPFKHAQTEVKNLNFQGMDEVDLKEEHKSEGDLEHEEFYTDQTLNSARSSTLTSNTFRDT